MDKREEVLSGALLKNAEETERWQNYKKENATVVENLDMYVKQRVVDVMVPVGRKAFMPGQLIHTNEVLVGHYQGYFSECSSNDAKIICQHRIKKAEEHLQWLENEAEMWQNKLDKPYVEGALPSGDMREIIEDYNEEAEELWRAQHKLRMKETKQREKEQRERENDDFNRTLVTKFEQRELMEELVNELETLEEEVVNYETVQQLMNEVNLPKKRRVAHNRQSEQKKSEIEQLNGVFKKTELETKPTNNKIRPKPEKEEGVEADESENIEECDPSEISVLPEAVQLIREQAEFLPPDDQIGFYDYQIQIIRQKLNSMPLRTKEDFDAKIEQISVRDGLEDLLETCQILVGEEELKAIEENDSEDESETERKANIKKAALNLFKPPSTQTRRISFALEDQTLEFRRNETVAEMLPKPEPPRDKITLDEPLLRPEKKSPSPPPVPPSAADKKRLILDRVEDQQKYISEHQSAQDFNLVDQILQTGECHTLHISFQHSEQPGLELETAPIANNPDKTIPGSPADLYHDFLRARDSVVAEPLTATAQTLFDAGYDGEENVKVPLMREVDRQLAYADPRTEFSTVISLNGVTKSILRNKEAVDNEKHLRGNISINYDRNQKPNNKKKKNKKKKSPPPVDEDEYSSAYYKVMDEVKEKSRENAVSGSPDPLPNCKFIDAHAPKKRISRFKHMRENM